MRLWLSTTFDDGISFLKPHESNSDRGLLGEVDMLEFLSYCQLSDTWKAVDVDEWHHSCFFSDFRGIGYLKECGRTDIYEFVSER